MSCLIYLETNWIVGAVMGQDQIADGLLSSSEADIHLAVPSVCLMEAISAFDWKRIERNRLKDELDRQLNQLRVGISANSTGRMNYAAVAASHESSNGASSSGAPASPK